MGLSLSFLTYVKCAEMPLEVKGVISIPITYCGSIIFKQSCCFKLAKDLKFYEQVDKEVLLICYMFLSNDPNKQIWLYLPLSLFQNDDENFKQIGDKIKFKKNNTTYNLTLDDTFEYLESPWYESFKNKNQ
jgi:hypothetical protein